MHIERLTAFLSVDEASDFMDLLTGKIRGQERFDWLLAKAKAEEARIKELRAQDTVDADGTP